jgi:2-(3-amino-3-carboxypropyl)histidine synthase
VLVLLLSLPLLSAVLQISSVFANEPLSLRFFGTVPVDTTSIRCLYVFVEIGVDTEHLLQTILLNFPACLTAPQLPTNAKAGPALSIGTDNIPLNDNEPRKCHLAVVGTVQFLNAVHGLKADLEDPSKARLQRSDQKLLTAEGDTHSNAQGAVQPESDVQWRVTIPQVKPLSPGEILGCTAPKLPKDIDGLL